jgi:hypothetical protein
MFDVGTARIAVLLTKKNGITAKYKIIKRQNHHTQKDRARWFWNYLFSGAWTLRQNCGKGIFPIYG